VSLDLVRDTIKAGGLPQDDLLRVSQLLRKIAGISPREFWVWLEDPHPQVRAVGLMALVISLPPTERLSLVPRLRPLSRDPDPYVRQIASHHLGRLGNPQMLDLSHERWGDEEIARLAVHLEHFTGLDLSATELGPAGAEALANSPGVESLRTLVLAANAVGDEGLRALAASPHLGGLVDLDVSEMKFTADALGEFLASGRLGSLRRLVLSGRPALGEALSRTPNSPLRLKELVVRLGALGSSAAEALGRSSLLQGVEALRVWGCALPDQGIEALAASGFASGLRVVELVDNPDLTDRSLQALSRAAGLTLEELTVRKSQIADAGLTALAESPLLGRLRRLDLAQNRIGPAGVQALAGSPRAAGLRVLNLAGNRVGPAGAGALARSPHLEALEFLDVSDSDPPLQEEDDVWYDWDGTITGVTTADPEALQLRRRFGDRVRI
jgi:hypothetical protein